MANHKDRLKELLGKIAVTTNTITVEDDISHYTILELLNALRSNVKEINKILDNLDEEVKKEIKEEIQRLIDDGTLDELINEELLDEIYSKVDELAEFLNKTNERLSMVANKGTTVEVLERVTKEEIDRQISDGTIASLMIMDDSVKNNHIANKAVSGEKTDFQFLDNLIDISKQTSVGKTYSLIANGKESESEALSEVIDIEPGEYFGYLEMTVTNIENYVGGYIGLRFIHNIVLDCYESFAGNNVQLFKKGKIFLYGRFSVGSAGQVKSVIRCYNTTANFSFNFKVEKLYLFKDVVVSDNEIEVLKKFDYSRVVSFFREKSIENFMIDNKAVSGEKTDFQFLDNLINISKQTSVGKTYSLIANGKESESEALSEVIDVEPGEYFGYLEMAVANIENYVGGYIGLRFIHTIALDCYESFAGTNAQLFKDGKIFLYGRFSVDSPGQVKSVIRCYNTTANYSFDFKVEKLYLFKDVVSDNEIEVLKKFDYSRVVSFFREKSIKSFMIDDDSILPNHLSESVYNKIFNTNKRTNIIDCWGDSLMAGAGGNGVTMPSELQKLLGDQYIVNNYGQGGEKAEEIAFRQGGLLAYAEPFTLKSDGTYTDIKVTSVDGLNFNNLNLSGTYFGNDKVDIDGVSCLFRKSGNDGFYKVAIAEAIPEDKVFNKKQLLIPESYHTLNGHIMIICIGQNGWISNNPSHLCGIIKNMIEKNNCNKYLVISRPTGDLEYMANEEVEFATTFGNNYFNAREYLSKYGLLDNNLTPTQQDIEAMNKGAIPPQLLVDNVHGNENFYKSYAIGVNEKLKLILRTIG